MARGNSHWKVIPWIASSKSSDQKIMNNFEMVTTMSAGKILSKHTPVRSSQPLKLSSKSSERADCSDCRLRSISNAFSLLAVIMFVVIVSRQMPLNTYVSKVRFLAFLVSWGVSTDFVGYYFLFCINDSDISHRSFTLKICWLDHLSTFFLFPVFLKNHITLLVAS